jgi:hypothetical protein
MAMPNVAMTETAQSAGPACIAITTIAAATTEPIAPPIPADASAERFFRVMPNSGPQRRPMMPTEQRAM